MPAFLAGYVLHAAAAVGFFTALFFVKSREKQSIAESAVAVALVTASVYVAQDVAVGSYVNSAGNRIFVSEWIGYSLSLFLIGYSLLTYLLVPHDQKTRLSFFLSLVGVGGVWGTLIEPPFTGARVFVFLATTFMYVLFIQGAYRYATRSRALLYYFVGATLFYIVPFALGGSGFAVISSSVEHFLYVVGNVLTKIILPALELWFIDYPNRLSLRSNVTTKRRLLENAFHQQ